MNDLIEKILREEISRRLDDVFNAERNEIEELREELGLGKFPRVQTHATPTKSGLSGSRKRTMVSRLISIPVGETQLFRTEKNLSVRKFVSRIRGHQHWLRVGHKVKISVKTAHNGAVVTRIA